MREDQAIGKFQGGATTKIHIAADAHGNPIYQSTYTSNPTAKAS